MKISKQEMVTKLNRVRLVFGNGADLYCGLKTSYSDFFESQKNLFAFIKKSFDDFGSYFYKQGITLPEVVFEIESSINFQPLIKQKITIWDILFYFSLEEVNHKVLWCDIEKIIHNSFIKSGMSNNKYPSIIHWDNINYLFEQKNVNQKDPYSSFVTVYAYILKEKIRKSKNDDFFVFLKQELIIFEKKFGKYIEKETAISSSLNKKRRKMIDLLANHKKISSIDTFNYSKMSFGEYEFEQRHINGDYENPIFGIDKSFDDLKENRLIPQADEFIKTSRRIDQELLDKRISNDKDFEHVVVFGHSLNQQDYSYFYPLLDQIRINDITCKSKFVVAYHIYDAQRSEEIRCEIKHNLFRFFSSYEKEHLGSKDARLLDYLTTQNRIILYRI